MRLLRAVVLLAIILVVVLWSQTANIIPHSGQHKHGGFDEVGTATPGPNVVPKTGSDNFLAANIGGTGAGAFTQGSVVFVGASGVYTQDNAGLFYKIGTGELGIGTATPTGRLDLTYADGLAVFATTHNLRLRRDTTDVNAYNLVLQKTRGGGATNDFDLIGQILFTADDSGGAEEIFARLNVRVRDASDTTEDGGLFWEILQEGTLATMLSLSNDAHLRVEDAVDGSVALLTLVNDEPHAAASLNEEVCLDFGLGPDLDAGRICVGKEDDYDPGPAENDSFMALYTDFDGTPRRRLFLDTNGMQLDQVPNFTLDFDLVAGDDVDDLTRIRLLNASKDKGWMFVFDQTGTADDLRIQDADGSDYLRISRETAAFSLLGVLNQTHFISFIAGDAVDDDVRLSFNNLGNSAGYHFLFDQSADSLIIQDQLEVHHITIPSDGGLKIHDIGAKPTCNAAHRGTTYYDEGASGVADTFEVCLKNTSDAYNWRAMATP